MHGSIKIGTVNLLPKRDLMVYNIFCKARATQSNTGLTDFAGQSRSCLKDLIAVDQSEKNHSHIQLKLAFNLKKITSAINSFLEQHAYEFVHRSKIIFSLKFRQ